MGGLLLNIPRCRLPIPPEVRYKPNMRIGIDARLVYYSRAGIGQYIMRLAEALARLEANQDEFILLQSRKDPTQVVNGHNFSRISLWTPSHHWAEQTTLRVET